MNPTKILIDLVFKKAAKETQSDVLTQQAKYIVDNIEDRFNTNISNKTLRNYYNALVKGNMSNVNIRHDIADNLSRFLDYENYAAFKRDNIVVKKKTKKIPQKVLIGSLICLAGYFGYEANTNKCMTWVDNTRYEKVGCEAVNTIPIDERLLTQFQRVEPDSTYTFFKEDGSPNLWYGKSISGKYEYFSNYGMHPITGKTLKGITDYIINKHILGKE